MINEQAANAVAVIDDTPTTALAEPTKPADLDLAVLSSYLTSWQQGGSTVTTFSARGIFHIADELGISVVENDFKETSNGKGFYFTAKAEHLATGRTFIAHVYQPATMKRSGKEVPDNDSISKGSTRVARNAISGLIPVELLKSRVQEAVKQGEIEKSALLSVQQAARQTLREQRQSLSDQFGLNPTGVFERAQDVIGAPSETWALDEWESFVKALQTLDANWWAE